MKKEYLIKKEEVISNLESNINGLSTKEANKRLNKYGKNVLPKKKQ